MREAATVRWLGAAALALAAGAAAAGELADPTRPPALVRVEAAADGERGSTAPVRVTSILIGEARRLATVDGRLVGVGDRIGGFEVAAIEPGAVELRAGDRSVRLVLNAQGMRVAERPDPVGVQVSRAR